MLLKHSGTLDGNLYVSSRINSLQTTKLNPGIVSVESNYVSSWINSLQTTKLNPGIVSVESSLCATIHWGSSCAYAICFNAWSLIRCISCASFRNLYVSCYTVLCGWLRKYCRCSVPCCLSMGGLFMFHRARLLRHCGNLYVSFCDAAYALRNPLCSTVLWCSSISEILMRHCAMLLISEIFMLHSVMLLKHSGALDGNLYVSMCYAAQALRNRLCSTVLCSLTRISEIWMRRFAMLLISDV